MPQSQTIEGSYRVLDNPEASEPDGDQDDFDRVAPRGGAGASVDSSASSFLSTIANPDTDLTHLAIVLAPTAYLFDMAVKRGGGVSSQVMYAVAGAALGVLALQVARHNGWLT